MKLRFFGHAALGLEAAGGLRVLTDPYEPGGFEGRLNYRPIPESWDVVLVTHEHADHNHVVPGFGKPAVVRGPATVLGMPVQAYTAQHGTAGGTVDAQTRIFRFVLDDMVIVHPGDIGPPVEESLVASLKGADILFVPVGGRFTLDAAEAADFVKRVAPRLVIPIHFQTAAVEFPIEPVEPFLERMPNVRRLAQGEVEIHTGNLPTRTQVWYLPPLLG